LVSLVGKTARLSAKNFLQYGELVADEMTVEDVLELELEDVLTVVDQPLIEEELETVDRSDEVGEEETKVEALDELVDAAIA
tara:strand:+ start:1275 stop:1520 length:246 start_codon:yes stop_codon:yes gene_type:complete